MFVGNPPRTVVSSAPFAPLTAPLLAPLFVTYFEEDVDGDDEGVELDAEVAESVARFFLRCLDRFRGMLWYVNKLLVGAATTGQLSFA